MPKENEPMACAEASAGKQKKRHFFSPPVGGLKIFIKISKNRPDKRFLNIPSHIERLIGTTRMKKIDKLL